MAPPDTFQILIGLFGGLALFLFGMMQMSDALKTVAGGGLKRLLGQLTRNRFTGVVTGAVMAAITQSSSVATVLVVGFVSAGLMSLGQSVAVIMGANVGTTVTVQLIAFDVTKYALVLVAAGFAVMFLARRDRWRFYGTAVMGLGLIFFGMDIMSEATEPLRSYQPFIDFMSRTESPMFGVLAGALITAVIQSSAATMGIVIILSSQGFVTLEGGIALVLGANVGTCVTALLAAIGKPREATQVALAHVLFNVIGVCIWIGFIHELALAARFASPVSSGIVDVAHAAAEAPRQIANAHTIFNIANTVLLIWFTGPLAWLINKLLPVREPAEGALVRPKYLDDNLLSTPALALDRVRLEIGRLGTFAFEMVREAPRVMIGGRREELDRLHRMDEQVDSLHSAIVTHLGNLSRQDLTPVQSSVLTDYLSVANYLENIGDMVETNLYDAGLERLGSQIEISESTRAVLRSLHEKVQWSVERSVTAFVDGDVSVAAQITDAKEAINELADKAEHHLRNRLTADAPDRITSFKVESEVVQHLKRVYYFAKRIAKTV
ncbi:MAG TPA: Na/Pi cotransporter family protein [Rhodothermales bacterium]|nr:Na/Pi cotransporter family protein [Rhodothermales bacterium]